MKRRQPIDTEHGDVFVASLEMEASCERIWHVLSAVDEWPSWHPFVTWTSAQIAGCSGSFTLLMGGSMFEAKVCNLEANSVAHVRCVIPDRPQPPAADCTVVTMRQTGDRTTVVAKFCLERWMQAVIESKIAIDESPPMVFLQALRRAVESRVVSVAVQPEAVPAHS